MLSGEEKTGERMGIGAAWEFALLECEFKSLLQGGLTGRSYFLYKIAKTVGVTSTKR